MLHNCPVQHLSPHAESVISSPSLVTIPSPTVPIVELSTPSPHPTPYAESPTPSAESAESPIPSVSAEFTTPASPSHTTSSIPISADSHIPVPATLAPAQPTLVLAPPPPQPLGLLNVTADGVVELLTDEADGQKFKTTDAVDVAHNGMIYFTDASYKYSLSKFIWDILEGKPHGRLMSYDPATKTTKVLVRNLYFANGVAVTPDQNYVIYCETPVRRCRKYHIQGKEKGRVENFIDYLPGMPDNIRYDGEGQYWIGLAMAPSLQWDLAFRYPFIRKVLLIMEKYIGRPHMEKNGGVMAVDMEGKPLAHYYDPGLALVSSGMKIGNHLYCGSVFYPYIIRLDLNQYPFRATT
ncbi:protein STRICTOSIDINE SYNTHASE-LIKE 5-like [Fagus crenata]